MKKTVSAALIVALILSYACCDGLAYDSKGKRDPFVPLVGVDKNRAAGLADVVSVDDVRLEGIAMGRKGRKAVMNGEIVDEGDRIGSIVIKAITDKAVILSINDTEYTVSLPEEGGAKGDKK